MFRYGVTLLVTWAALCDYSFGCSCIGARRPCERLRADAVFVGRVIETLATQHLQGKDSWSPGFSMRFSVDEALRGALGTEVVVETGSGGGDCGTPLSPGARLLIFAYKVKDGSLWTGLCSGNVALNGGPEDDSTVQVFRELAKTNTGKIFGRVTLSKLVWEEDKVLERSASKPVEGMVVSARSDDVTVSAKTDKDGAFEFRELPNGKYKVAPENRPGTDYDHRHNDWYEAEVSGGVCASISFRLQPATRIRGHLTFPAGINPGSIMVVAVPADIRKVHQFTGTRTFTEDDRFDLWPLPPGDYFVGVNIAGSPKEDSPFPPTYYPGVTRKEAAGIVHLEEGEVKELELHLPELAKPRQVSFVAIGVDGKPMSKIYIQREDLRHPGDAASYVNVDLDAKGAGTMTVYSGFSYHLHASQSLRTGKYWCAPPVLIPAGTKPVQVRFVMNQTNSICDLKEIDRLQGDQDTRD